MHTAREKMANSAYQWATACKDGGWELRQCANSPCALSCYMTAGLNNFASSMPVKGLN